MAGIEGNVRDHVDNQVMVQWRMAASVYPPLIMTFFAVLVAVWKHFDGAILENLVMK